MVEEINYDRRRFLATTIMTIAGAQFGIIGFTVGPAGLERAVQLDKDVSCICTFGSQC